MKDHSAQGDSIVQKEGPACTFPFNAETEHSASYATSDSNSSVPSASTERRLG